MGYCYVLSPLEPQFIEVMQKFRVNPSDVKRSHQLTPVGIHMNLKKFKFQGVSVRGESAYCHAIF